MVAESLPDGLVRFSSSASETPAEDGRPGRVSVMLDATGKVHAVEFDGTPWRPDAAAGEMPPAPPEAPIGLTQLLLPRAASLKTGDRLTLQNRTPEARGGERGHHVSQAHVLGGSEWRGRQVVVLVLAASVATLKPGPVAAFQLHGYALVDMATGWVVHEDWWSVMRSGLAGDGGGYVVACQTITLSLAAAAN